MINYHNRKSYRLKGWNYANPGLYFITICCQNRWNYLGNIQNDIMGLSVPGCIAWHFWRQIPKHHPNVELDAFIVMPNHVHGIIGIKTSDYGLITTDAVGTCHGMSLPHRNKFSEPESESISMIVNHFKGSVTRWCHQYGIQDFAWQPRFYDHIIRNDRELNHIQNYVILNPIKWQEDQEFR